MDEDSQTEDKLHQDLSEALADAVEDSVESHPSMSRLEAILEKRESGTSWKAVQKNKEHELKLQEELEQDSGIGVPPEAKSQKRSQTTNKRSSKLKSNLRSSGIRVSETSGEIARLEKFLSQDIKLELESSENTTSGEVSHTGSSGTYGVVKNFPRSQLKTYQRTTIIDQLRPLFRLALWPAVLGILWWTWQ